MRLENLKLTGVDFKWGDDIDKIKSRFSGSEIFENDNPYSRAKTLRVKVSDQWGIPCNSCTFSAPHYDRMVNDLDIKIGDYGDDIEFLIRSLEYQFGERSSDFTGKNHGSGSVIRNSTWEFENCKVGISVFGAKRDEYGEENFGMIYFHFTDITVFHDLYSTLLQIKALQLESDGKDKNIELLKFTMKEPQLPAWGREKKNYPHLEITYISDAFNGFYKRKLITAPSWVKAELSDNQIGLFLNPVDDTYYITNFWSATSLKGVESAFWINTLPAKGPGRGVVSVGELTICNSHSQQETKKLVAQLEKILNINIRCDEDYDC